MLPLFFIALSGHDAMMVQRNIGRDGYEFTPEQNSSQTSLRLPGSLNDPGVFLQGVP